MTRLIDPEYEARLHWEPFPDPNPEKGRTLGKEPAAEEGGATRTPNDQETDFLERRDVFKMLALTATEDHEVKGHFKNGRPPLDPDWHRDGDPRFKSHPRLLEGQWGLRLRKDREPDDPEPTPSSPE